MKPWPGSQFIGCFEILDLRQLHHMQDSSMNGLGFNICFHLAFCLRTMFRLSCLLDRGKVHSSHVKPMFVKSPQNHLIRILEIRGHVGRRGLLFL